MKLDELLAESQAQNRGFTDLLWAKFRKLAKDKFNLVFDLPLGWPVIGKKKVAFGGILKDPDRRSAEDKAEDLPLELRIKGFLKVLSKELASLAADGHTIEVLPGMRNTSAGSKIAIEVSKADEIYDAFVSTMVRRRFAAVASGPAIGFSVSVPETHNHDMTPFVLEVRTGFKPVFRVHTFVPTADKKSIQEFKSFKSISDYPAYTKLSPEKRKELAVKIRGLLLTQRANVPEIDPVKDYYIVKVTSFRQVSKYSKQLDLPEFRKLVDSFRPFITKV